MLSVRSRPRLSSISPRSTSGRPCPGWNPPLVATTTPSGKGARAAPIVCSLSPPVYRWAVSMKSIPAATASLTNASCSRVLVSRFVPSPIRPTSVSPSFRVAGMSCSLGDVPGELAVVAVVDGRAVLRHPDLRVERAVRVARACELAGDAELDVAHVAVPGFVLVLPGVAEAAVARLVARVGVGVAVRPRSGRAVPLPGAPVHPEAPDVVVRSHLYVDGAVLRGHAFVESLRGRGRQHDGGADQQRGERAREGGDGSHSAAASDTSGVSSPASTARSQIGSTGTWKRPIASARASEISSEYQ